MPSNPPALMWFEDNARVSIARRLKDGADVYKIRLGVDATHVIVSPDEYAACVEAAPATLKVVPSNPRNGTVAKNVYWFLRNGGE